jgi:hypothetical protein
VALRREGGRDRGDGKEELRFESYISMSSAG